MREGIAVIYCKDDTFVTTSVLKDMYYTGNGKSIVRHLEQVNSSLSSNTLSDYIDDVSRFFSSVDYDAIEKLTGVINGLERAKMPGNIDYVYIKNCSDEPITFKDIEDKVWVLAPNRIGVMWKGQRASLSCNNFIAEDIYEFLIEENERNNKEEVKALIKENITKLIKLYKEVDQSTATEFKFEMIEIKKSF